LAGIDWVMDSLIDTGANILQPDIFFIASTLVENAVPWDVALSLIDDFEFMAQVIIPFN
jgi:hypothetical protein